MNEPIKDVDDATFWAEFHATQKKLREIDSQNAIAAIPALYRLVKVCGNMSGQSFKLRSMLYSLWNGKPTSLVEIVNLDRCLREDLLSVMRAFGSQDFFYEKISEAFRSAGLFEWFISERSER
jgi:hypothetical protein